MSVKRLDTPIPQNQPNNPFIFKKGNFVSFNSSDPFQFNINNHIRLERGIIEEVKGGTVIISYWDRNVDQKVHCRRKIDMVKIIIQSHICLGCTEEPRVPSLGSLVVIKPNTTPSIKPNTVLQPNLCFNINTYLGYSSTITNKTFTN